MKIETIVVGVDFSEHAEGAVREAMRVARASGAQIALIHAGPVIERGELSEDEKNKIYESELRRYVDAAFAEVREELEALRQRYSGQGVELSHAIHEGGAADALCAAAAELEADLIVVGSRGRTGVERFLLGSVAEKVIRQADRPVMVARPSDKTSPGFDRVLVPVNFDDLSDPVVATAVGLAAEGGDVELLHCWHLPYMLVDDWGGGTSSIVKEVRDAMLERSSGKLSELTLAHRRSGVTIHHERVESGARSGITKRVHDGEYDLVVIGGHQKRTLTERFIGNVAQTTVRHAPCSVIVVKDRG